jgi:hypothetical protein
MPTISLWVVRTALLYLGTGVTLGSYMLAAKGARFDVLALRWVPVHIEMLLFGWLVQLALGVAAWILPRFTHPPKYGNLRLAWSAYGLFNAGILTIILGAWFLPGSFEVVLIGRILEILAVIGWAIFLFPRVKPFAE